MFWLVDWSIYCTCYSRFRPPRFRGRKLPRRPTSEIKGNNLYVLPQPRLTTVDVTVLNGWFVAVFWMHSVLTAACQHTPGNACRNDNKSLSTGIGDENTYFLIARAFSTVGVTRSRGHSLPRVLQTLEIKETKVKLKTKSTALNQTPSQSFGVSLAIWGIITRCYLPPDTSEHTPKVYLPTRRDRRLSTWPRWLVTYRDGLLAHRRSLLHVLTWKSKSRPADHGQTDVRTTCLGITALTAVLRSIAQ